MTVLARNYAYVIFRRYQLRSIEQRLSGLTTFANVYKAFYNNEKVTFIGLDETFKADKNAKTSSTKLENRLPQIIMIFWIIVFIAGIWMLVVPASLIRF